MQHSFVSPSLSIHIDNSFNNRSSTTFILIVLLLLVLPFFASFISTDNNRTILRHIILVGRMWTFALYLVPLGVFLIVR